MPINQNIHPSYHCLAGKARKWETVVASFGGKGLGNCVTLNLTDQDGERVSFIIHYADDPQGFVDKLKTAILSLPAIVREDA